MKPFQLILVVISLIIFYSCKKNESFNYADREINFNTNWKFIRSDKTGAELPGFDDSEWRTLNLPHDYSIEDLPEKEGVLQIGPFSEESPGKESTGHVMGGIAWYRKHFTLNKNDEDKIIKILFDGIYMNSDVWINGVHLGNHPYGYTAFYYDLTAHLNPPGEENVLAVQVKNEGVNSRWYSGSGIYRNVKLVKTNPVYINIWGNYITTPEVSAEKATIEVETEIVNSEVESGEYGVLVTIKNKNEIVANSKTNFISTVQGKDQLTQKIIIDNPQLWDTENPHLYTAVVQIIKSDKVVDETHTHFGIRSLDFSPEKGFLLNGNQVLLKGGCLHHDNGILGSAAFKSAEYRRVKNMKKNGFNAIRCAHNPPSEVFLNACDELGILVMNESFDMWQVPKKENDYSNYFDEWWERDTESMLLRDRNHPSIIIWSMGNEISERGFESGLEIFDKLIQKTKQLDKTRPLTQAVCRFWEHPGKPWEDTEPIFEKMDVHGYNYQWRRYETDHTNFPKRIIVGTESIAQEAFGNWELVEKKPYVIGDFVWTGMDHLGESGIGFTKLDNDTTKFLPPWPWHINNSGDISVLGDKKPQMYFRDVVWRNSLLEMLVHAPIPKGTKEIVSFWGWPNEWKSWNWKGNEGNLLQVAVYTRCEQVKLELNGEEIGNRKVSVTDSLKVYFHVPYQPGELVAIGLKDGKEVVRRTIKTAGEPAEIEMTAEEKLFENDQELFWLNVKVLDENGLLIPDAVIPIEFEIKGKAKLQAVGNGNPRDMKSFQQVTVNTFRGKCQMVLRAEPGANEIMVLAKSEGLKSGEATILVQ